MDSKLISKYDSKSIPSLYYSNLRYHKLNGDIYDFTKLAGAQLQNQLKPNIMNYKVTPALYGSEHSDITKTPRLDFRVQ